MPGLHHVGCWVDDLAEAHNRPLFSAVLGAAGVAPGTSVLDVGCGAGLTLMLAAERGALVSGLDVSPGLLDVARRRLPGADLRDGDMESLPFPDAAFDAVVGVNAFQFAGDPRLALRGSAGQPSGRAWCAVGATPAWRTLFAPSAALPEAPGQRKRRARARSAEPSALSSPGFRRR
jgi:SAM-dependent methyltransferase